MKATISKIALIAVLLGTTPALAQQPCPCNSKLRWNWHEETWQYACQDWTLQFNWHTKKWVWAPPPPNSEYKWNWQEKKWELVPK